MQHVFREQPAQRRVRKDDSTGMRENGFQPSELRERDKRAAVKADRAVADRWPVLANPAEGRYDDTLPRIATLGIGDDRSEQ